jgi:hypothetical protein
MVLLKMAKNRIDCTEFKRILTNVYLSQRGITFLTTAKIDLAKIVPTFVSKKGIK